VPAKHLEGVAAPAEILFIRLIRYGLGVGVDVSNSPTDTPSFPVSLYYVLAGVVKSFDELITQQC
jgi:hypothetical protein